MEMRQLFWPRFQLSRLRENAEIRAVGGDEGGKAGRLTYSAKTS